LTYTFEHVDTKSELVNRLKSELPKFGFSNVKVLKSDPAAPSELPCIGINRLDDSETSQSIADVAGDYFDKETKVYYKTYGTYFQESLEIRIWHTNADERDRLYRHLKAILLAIRLPLVEQGLRNLTLRTGRDEQEVTGQNAPVAIYWSTINLSALNPLDVTFEEVTEAITAIDVTTKFSTGGVLNG
jgi:hypothetical protein